MEHINITFPEHLKKELDKQVKIEKTKRSTLIQKAVKLYLDLKHRREQMSLLAEGYLAMDKESKQIMKDFEYVDEESWKYND